MRDKMRGYRFAFNNKCGRLLARTIHPRNSAVYISKMTTLKGSMTYSLSHITVTFRSFYESLYNLHGKFDALPPNRLQDNIFSYLTTTTLSKVPEIDIQGLNKPFQDEEFFSALSLFQVGKSPRPDGFLVRF